MPRPLASTIAVNPQIPAKPIIPINPVVPRQQIIQNPSTVPIQTGTKSIIGVKPPLPLSVSTLPVKSVIAPAIPPAVPQTIQPITPIQPVVGQVPNLQRILPTQPIQPIMTSQMVNPAILPPALGMNRPAVYNASTYRPINIGGNLPAYNGISGYRTSSLGSVGSYGNIGNMNRPIQYASKTYNARKL
jgi:hypothetical protein